MEQSLSSSIAKEVWRLAIQSAMASLAEDIGGNEAFRRGLPPEVALDMFRRRLDVLGRGLTPRELDVCARALIGMTAEGIALDLNIKKSSVSTYRKRAYARLGISSQNQLYRLLA
jgi:DNA-binding CsgD family transcriptional regulator